MKGFQELLAHVSTQLDIGVMTRESSSVVVAEYILRQLACTRVSVWVLEGEAGERTMKRIAGFDGVRGAAITEPAVLREAQFAAYFDALTSKGVYACPDVAKDPNMAALLASYLAPNGIGSSLDVTIGVNGNTWGVFCCAQEGSREWTPQEMRLLKRFADAISVRRARRRRREADAAALMQRLLEAERLPTDTPAA